MARNSLKNVARLINSAQNEQPIEKAFLSDLKRSIELTDQKYARKPSQTYKPSSMKCIRNMYYAVTGKEPDPSETSYCLIGICNAGTDAHVRIQDAVNGMKDNGMDCEYVDVAEYVKSRGLDYLEIKERNASGTETKLYHKYLNISFMCDGIIKYLGKYYILELKTENISKWGQRKDVNPDHYNQAIAYSLSLGIEEVMFVYICRDNSDMKSYLFKVTDDMRNELVDKINTLEIKKSALTSQLHTDLESDKSQ